ncbi:MAG: RHS repeat protein [Fibrobacteres bacterium]|nr:RHS repeat protein [Fibrobacterota bacterium]
MNARIFCLLIILPLVAQAGLSRHNEQGLSPTHSYKRTGDGVVSNLNGNLVQTSTPVSIPGAPLGVELSRTWNSHWREPLFALQYDMDYNAIDLSDSSRRNPVYRDRDVTESTLNIGGFATRRIHRISNPQQIPKTWGFTQAVSLSLVQAAANAAIQRAIFNQYSEFLTRHNALVEILGKDYTKSPEDQAKLDKINNETMMALQAVKIALYAVNGAGDDFRTLQSCASSAAGDRTSAKGDCGQAMFNVASNVGGQFIPYISDINMGYKLATGKADGEDVAWYIGEQLGQYVVANIVGGGLSGGVAGVALAATVQMTRLYISLVAEWEKTYDVGYVTVNPWSVGVNGYVGMLGVNHDAELNRSQSRYQRNWIHRSIEMRDSVIDTVIQNHSLSRHPMAELQLVASDGGATRFVLSDDSARTLDGRRWVSYEALSNAEMRKIYYCLPRGMEDRIDLGLDPNPAQYDPILDSSGYYLVKEPGGTQVVFGLGAANKGMIEDGGFDTYWAVPGLFRSSTADSVVVTRDGDHQIQFVRDARTGRGAVLFTDSIVSGVVSPDGKLTRQVDVIWQGLGQHEFLGYKTGRDSPVNWKTPVIQWEARRVSDQQIDTTWYNYSNGELTQVDHANGSSTVYAYEGEHYGKLDGFVLSATNFPDRTNRQFYLQRNYGYQGWEETKPAGLKTSVQTLLRQPDHVVAPDQPWRETQTTDWYFFSPIFEAKNINRKLAGFQGRTTVLRLDGSVHDTDKVLDSLEYRTTRFQLTMEYHGAGSMGQRRTQTLYDGDRQIAKIDSRGLNQLNDPKITVWNYDRNGSLVRETVCPKTMSDTLRARVARIPGMPAFQLDCPEVKTEFGVRHRDAGEFWLTTVDTTVVNDPLMGGNLRVAVVNAKPNPTFRTDSLYRLELSTSKRTWRRGSVRDDGTILANDSIMMADSTEWEDWRPSTGATPFPRPVRQRVWLDGKWQMASETRYADADNRPALISRSSRYLSADSVSVIEADLDSVYKLLPARTRQYVRPQPAGVAPTGPSLDTARFFDVDRGWVLAKKDPAGNVTRMEYDRAGRPTKTITPDGAVMQYGYVDRLQPTSSWLNVPGYASNYPNQKTVAIRETSPVGVTTEARFDGLGRMVALRRLSKGASFTTLDTAQQTTTLFSYNVFDKLQWKRDADGREEWHDFDGTGREVASRVYIAPAAASNLSKSWENRYQYLDSARTYVEIDPIGTRTWFHWDALGRDTLVERDADTAAFVMRLGGEATASTSAPLATQTLRVRSRFDNLGNLIWQQDPKGLVEYRRYDGLGRMTRTTYSDDLRHSVGYDLAGRALRDTLQMVSKPESTTVRTTRYDGLDRPLQESFGAGARENVDYVWDSRSGVTDAGRLLGLNLGTGLGVTYSYDAMGRRLSRNIAFPSLYSVTQSWKYDLSGIPVQASLPGAGRLDWSLDSYHRPASQAIVHGTDSVSVLSGIRYRRNDLVDGFRQGNRLNTRYSYEAQRSVLTEAVVTKSPATDTMYLQRMTWDGAGNVAGMRRNLGDSLGFDVDHQYQLRNIRYPDGQALSTSYDWNGNRTRLVHPMGRGMADTFGYAANRVTVGSSARKGTTIYRYDARGNLSIEASFAWASDTSDMAKAWRVAERRWNKRNALERARIITRLERTDTTWLRFEYGEDGNRILSLVAKGDTSSWTPVHKWVYEGSAIAADSGSDHGWKWHAYMGQNRIAEATDSAGKASVRYVLTDHQGTTQALLTDTGAVLGRWIWDPWGNLEESWSQQTTDLLYQGKAYEAALGNWYFNARFYDAERGSFIGRDPKLQFWTPYSYGGNGPLVGVDPDGENWYLYPTKGDPISGENGKELIAAVNGLGKDVKIYKLDIWGHGNSWWQGFDMLNSESPHGLSGNERGVTIEADNRKTLASLGYLLQGKMAVISEIWLRGCEVAQGDDNIARQTSIAVPEVKVYGSTVKRKMAWSFIRHQAGRDDLMQDRVYISGVLQGANK